MTADHGEFRGYYASSGGGAGTGRFVRLTLPAAPQAVRLARRATRDALAAWLLGDLAETAVLLVSELVTNAVLHARDTGTVTLKLTSAGPWLRIEITDADPRWPRQRPLDPFAESGFGFVLVDALASKWGVRPTPPGKTVWAELDTLASTR